MSCAGFQFHASLFFYVLLEVLLSSTFRFRRQHQVEIWGQELMSSRSSFGCALDQVCSSWGAYPVALQTSLEDFKFFML